MIEVLKAFAPYLTPMMSFASFIIGLAAVFMASKFVPRKEYEDNKDGVETILQLHADYITGNKRDMEHLTEKISTLPDAQSIHLLSMQMLELKGELKVFSEKFVSIGLYAERMQIQIDRMDEFLKTRKP